MRCDRLWCCVVDPAQHLPPACIQERLRPVAEINSCKKNMHSLKHAIDGLHTADTFPHHVGTLSPHRDGMHGTALQVWLAASKAGVSHEEL